MNNLEELYKLYQVEPRKIPQEIPSSGEVIGYDTQWQEFNELKCYHIIKCLFDIQVRLDIDKQEKYNILCLDGKDSIHPEFVFHEDGETLEEAIIKVLITLYDEIPEHYQLALRNILEQE